MHMCVGEFMFRIPSFPYSNIILLIPRGADATIGVLHDKYQSTFLCGFIASFDTIFPSEPCFFDLANAIVAISPMVLLTDSVWVWGKPGIDHHTLSTQIVNILENTRTCFGIPHPFSQASESESAFFAFLPDSFSPPPLHSLLPTDDTHHHPQTPRLHCYIYYNIP